MTSTRRLIGSVFLALALTAPAAAQTGTVMPYPKFTALTNTGAPCASCKLYTYAAGTTTPQATYPDNTLTPGTANTNPVVLDGSGRATIFLSQTSYRFDLKTSADVLIWSVDNVTSISPLSDLAVSGTAGQTLTAGDVVFLSDGQGGLTPARWYKADATNAYSSSTATVIGMVPSAISAAASGTVRLGGHGLLPSASLTPGTDYYVSSTPGVLTTTAPTNSRLVGRADATTTLVLTQAGATAAANTLMQTFRGLQLRTHPDGDVAVKKILFSADEIVMDDGTRLANWSNLVADITASGANGLDTGAEGASRWYEIYAIAKADGTQGALLHRAKNYSVDTSFLTATDAGRALRVATTTSTDKLAQGVIFATTGPLTFVDIPILRTGAVAGNIWVSIQASSAGDASGTPLATSDKIVATNGPATGEQTVRFIFRSPFTVTASTQYHLVLEGDYTRSDAVNITWRGVAAGGYASGVARQYNGATWANATGVGDFDFAANLTVNDTAVTLPSGYTKKAKLGYVFNNSSSDFVAFSAHDRDVKYDAVTTLTLGGGGAAANQTLVDCSAAIPPIPVTVTQLAFTTATAGNFLYLSPVLQASTFIEMGLRLTSSFTTRQYVAIMLPIEDQYVYYGSDGTVVSVAIDAWRW